MWKDYYKFPLHNELNIKAFTADWVMAYDYVDWNQSDEYYQNILDIINGNKESNLEGDFTIKGCEIYQNGKPFLVIRGWGHLTGPGGLHLPTEKAIEIQDSFVEYIVQRLKN